MNECLNFYAFIESASQLLLTGLGLCEGGEIEAKMFNLVQMLNRIPMLKFSTNAPLLQNPC